MFPLRDRLSLASSAAFAALAGLVSSGALTGIDQWACDHLMPFARKPGLPPTFLDSLVPLFHATWHPAGAAVMQVVTLPGQVVVSFALVLLGAWRLRAPRWVGVWIAAVAVEVLVRHVLPRPALYRDGLHVVSFDASWPSGHALRCTLVAVIFALAWPRARWILGAWLVAAVALLLLAGAHTPTDLLGGLLLALLACRAALRSGALRER